MLQNTIFVPNKITIMHFFILLLISAISTNSLIISVKPYDVQRMKENSFFYSNDTTLDQSGNQEKKIKKVKEKNRAKAHNGEKSANRRALWGFIFGCASIVLFPLFCIPGLILSNDALWEERMHPGTLTRTNKTLAYLGKIFSWVGIGIIVVAILYLAFIIAFVSALG